MTQKIVLDHSINIQEQPAKIWSQTDKPFWNDSPTGQWKKWKVAKIAKKQNNKI